MAQVSIIVPAYNCEAYIDDCIHSITRQSARDIEIIAIDDGSSDRTLSILEKLAKGDQRICLQSHSPNSGSPGFARNQGIAHATGKYIAFLDADDLYHPEKIRKILNVFEAFPASDVVFHDVLRFDGREPQKEGTGFLETKHFLEEAAGCLKKVGDAIYRCDPDLYQFASLEFFPCHTSAITVRKDVLLDEPVWFPEDRQAGEDGDLCLRLLKRRRFVFVDEVLSYYRQRSGSITSSAINYLAGAARIHRDNLERGKDIFSEHEQELYKLKLARLWSDLGYAYFYGSRPSDARQAYRESLAIKFRLGTLLAYSKTLVPRAFIANYRQSTQRPQR
jgi:glycosyltransferase involved in cell wall biosynthesis